ncbi:glycosyl hydrolase family 18 protein [Bacillus massilinigeriensis]|uniref:glycosyl hydrolase family 18 protein n=1 Tax=Bacillus massilionigeriensis TaxID=1805475 RepID=UPI00096B614E|nr:glycosyl hydrolase family 18 protein [Bacillus massilionigeriensis]
MTRIETYKKKSLGTKPIILGLLIAIILIVSSILLLLYPFASKEKSIYFSGDYPILFEGKQQGNAILVGKSVYVPISFMKKFIDDSIVYDVQSKSIIITTKDKVVQMPSKSLTYFINEKPVKLQVPPIQDKNGDIYVALDPILNYYPIKYSILSHSNAVQIQQNGDIIQTGTVINKDINEEKLRLRTKPDIQSPYTAQTKREEKLYIEDEKEEYYYVRKADGVAGYLKKDYIEGKHKNKISVKHIQQKVELKKINEPINLTWEAVYSLNPDTNQIPNMPGVNVVSPTWFKLASKDGSIHNLGSTNYVKWAKKKGYQVWGLFSNAFDPELTHDAFQSFETRQEMIRQLIMYSQMYRLNGINIDIENVNQEDGPYITQFVREATPYFHEAGLTVSMDITFMADGSNWSSFYEREKLAKTVDYLIVMAYDEHWGTSPVAGSVASFPWVEENLNNLLKVVPNEKLILGVPLYTRIWAEKDSGEVSSKAVSMEDVKKWLKDKKVKPKYDEASGQNYAEYYSKKEKTTYKIWLEDEFSLSKRAELAEKYDLVGIASWSRFFADDSAWTALNLSKKQMTKK